MSLACAAGSDETLTSSKPEAQPRGIRVHGGCYFAGGRTNIPSAVSWITGIASFGSKTP